MDRWGLSMGLAVLLIASPRPGLASQNQGEPLDSAICLADRASERVWTPPFKAPRGIAPESKAALLKEWGAFLGQDWEIDCIIGSGLTMDDARTATGRWDIHDKWGVRKPRRMISFSPSWDKIIAAPAKVVQPKTKKMESQPKSAVEEVRKQAADEAARLKAQREAEFQAKLKMHEANVAEYKRRLAQRELEIARQREQHVAAQEAAARAQAAHRRDLDEANRRQQEYFAAQRRHSLCLTGDQKACDDIAAGKSALGDEAATQEASTDTDANRCVTTAEVRLNATFQGNTSASVMNGCGKPVDIRICLKRNNDWNCGVTSAVAPQGQGVHSSFEATGEIFVDARTTGNPRPFANPPS